MRCDASNVWRERPDHGDNLKDDERGLFGHFLSNEYDLPIPMLFWFSDE